MFFNELHDIMVENEVRGIHLFPDIIAIFMLMFADDIACISDTIPVYKDNSIHSNSNSNIRLYKRI